MFNYTWTVLFTDTVFRKPYLQYLSKCRRKAQEDKVSNNDCPAKWSFHALLESNITFSFDQATPHAGEYFYIKIACGPWIKLQSSF